MVSSQTLTSYELHISVTLRLFLRIALLKHKILTSFFRTIYSRHKANIAATYPLYSYSAVYK